MKQKLVATGMVRIDAVNYPPEDGPMFDFEEAGSVRVLLRFIGGPGSNALPEWEDRQQTFTVDYPKSVAHNANLGKRFMAKLYLKKNGEVTCEPTSTRLD